MLVKYLSAVILTGITLSASVKAMDDTDVAKVAKRLTPTVEMAENARKSDTINAHQQFEWVDPETKRSWDVFNMSYLLPSRVSKLLNVKFDNTKLVAEFEIEICSRVKGWRPCASAMTMSTYLEEK